MNFFNLYFIVIYRFLHVTLHKNTSDAKFSALLYASMFSYLILMYLFITFCIIFNRALLNGITNAMLKIYMTVFPLFALVLNYLWFYHINDVAYLEEKYLEYSLKKRKFIGVLVVLSSIASILVGFIFINKKVFPDL